MVRAILKAMTCLTIPTLCPAVTRLGLVRRLIRVPFDVDMKSWNWNTGSIKIVAHKVGNS